MQPVTGHVLVTTVTLTRQAKAQDTDLMTGLLTQLLVHFEEWFQLPQLYRTQKKHTPDDTGVWPSKQYEEVCLARERRFFRHTGVAGLCYLSLKAKEKILGFFNY